MHEIFIARLNSKKKTEIRFGDKKEISLLYIYIVSKIHWTFLSNQKTKQKKKNANMLTCKIQWIIQGLKETWVRKKGNSS